MDKVLDFLKDVRLELKKVTWPTKQQTFKLTFIVIIITLALAAFLGLLDFIFVHILEKLLF